MPDQLPPEMRHRLFPSFLQAVNSVTPYNGALLIQLKRQIDLKADELFNAQRVHTEAEITALAQAKAAIAPQIPVTRYNTYNSVETRYRTVTESYERSNPAGWFRKYGWREVQVPYDYPVSTQVPYTVMVAPDYNGFMNIAREELKPKDRNSFLPQARTIIAEGIRKTVIRN